MLRIAYAYTYQGMDRGLLEFIGPQGIATEIYSRSRDLTSLSIGFVFRRFFILMGTLTLALAFISG